MSKHTYDTGIIGNCAFLAHINKNTNVDWLCWPRFDSTFIFGGLLDKDKGGEFSIRPEGEYTTNQHYLENTNILITEICPASGGKYRITDFAPRFYQHQRYYKPLMLIRKIEVIEGSPRIIVKCAPVSEYGAVKLSVNRGSNHIQYLGGEENIRLTTNIPISYVFDGQAFVLNETKYLAMTYGEPLEAPLISTADRFLAETVQYWRTWIKHSSIATYFQPFVIRSALALKIHQYEDTGAIIAASTTSLPESPGSGRNWDYRYCWLRDTYYVITALNHIGHFEEMEKYFGYVTDITFSEMERYQPLYGITGKKDLVEHILTDLAGYMGNQPVRIGNQASEHIQNDIYGQVLISLLPLYTDHRFVFSERKDSVHWVEFLLSKIEHTIDEKDAGIWEFRNMANIHCYSNLFQWAGASAAEKMARTIQNQELIDKAISLKERAAAHIESCYDPVRKVYTNSAGSSNLDASTLQLIMMNYLDPNSQKAKDHLVALEKELKTPNGLFYRYLYTDDFGKPKTTFLICAFWYVEALAAVGRLDDAQREFGNLLQYSNHLLLFSEDVDERDGSQWGNFPQAYSHVGLMNAAYRIAMKLDRPIFL
ncbi:glycoside hydrolase family 15 protein [Mucilaginibacter rubeus]|uniref:Glycoside hydrolase family 15 protein n=1 Tax=Mucilaginibacter rubeus TaxID=2027860 RepID=A0AAE6MI78_9SPHI|nr:MULTISPECIES: glycoside hydrolase family 15 protein [Mucilaginibacter]QEM03922.1 glycoside hydrolase family 15 protein [Mucilaginibacter rubeus]QEM16532.1 glycoside hydrolase family 15 protein [Mucilaginibacter gossypii]QTE40699.1 glycoside hydrolase family 15 protein [Mucilaginibacter rubeus]QTE47301.1 glycoside hydrolase family 15 protein [Mucilaginibacter rubeus]QTE58694.1 glycoside hydrolase family 15 protein [Mucilaginibacter rubeus]